MKLILALLLVVCLVSAVCFGQRNTPGPTFGDDLVDCEICEILIAQVEGTRNSHKSFDFLKKNWKSAICSDDSIGSFYPLTQANCSKFFDIYGLKAFNEFKGGIWTDYCRKIGYCIFH